MEVVLRWAVETSQPLRSFEVTSVAQRELEVGETLRSECLYRATDLDLMRSHCYNNLPE